MLLIYTDTITSRLDYTCEFIFTRVILCSYRLTSDGAEFEQYKGAKLNYSHSNFQGAFQVAPKALLFEKSIEPLDFSGPDPLRNFAVEKSDTGFDIFALVFYMISRYEEWLPYTPDKHGRFEAKESMLFKSHALDIPLVDERCYNLKNALQNKFPELAFQKRQYRYLSTIDVDNSYAYLGKPLYRTIGASVKDILKGNIAQLKQRSAVLRGKRKDPFDAYDFQVKLADSKHPLLYFFLTVNKQTEYDRPLPAIHPLFKQMISTVKEQASLGIHPSYFSQAQNKLSSEKKQLEQLLGKPVTKSRQHYLHFDIRTTPQLLISQGIKEDYTMGFASHYGFRAGTCTPFKYFDLQKNEATALEMIPFCAMDSVFYDYLGKSAEEAETIINKMMSAIKKVDGMFVSVWHDRSFSELHFPGWKALYEKLQVN